MLHRNINNSHNKRPAGLRARITRILACCVVFITVYALILPAISINRDSAEAEDGIVLGTDTAQTAEGTENGTLQDTSFASKVTPTDVAEETAAPADEQTVPGPDAADSTESIQADAQPDGSGSVQAAADDAAPDAVSAEDVQAVPGAENTGADVQANSSGTAAGGVVSEDKTLEMPAMSFTLSVDDITTEDPDDKITITAEAEENTFPAGTTMTVKAVTDEKKLADIQSAAEKAVSDDSAKKAAEALAAGDVKTAETEATRKVADIRALDITFRDAQGNEIEPAQPVRVTVTSGAIAETKLETSIVHVDDTGKGEVVEPTDKVLLPEEPAEDQIVFDTDAFSYYVLAGTTIEKTIQASDGQSYIVSVTYPSEAGVPEDASLAVSEITEAAPAADKAYSEYVSGTESALGIPEGTAGYIRLFDIRIVDQDGAKVEIQAPVSVQIVVADNEDRSRLNVVHFADGAPAGSVVASSTENVDEAQVVRFAADGFSVYAVVGSGEIEEESRVTVNFYGKDTDTPIATVYVKNSDTADDLEDIVYDPGCGELGSKELFDGWSISTLNTTDGTGYTLEEEGLTIEDIRAYLEALEISEGDVLNIYARVVKTATVSYRGEVENVLLGTVTVKMLQSDESAEYTVNMNYTPASSEQAFMGWLVADGAGNIVSAEYQDESLSEPPYPNGTVLTISGDVALAVNAPAGHWLVFDENGKGATYNAPQFVESGEVTVRPPVEMERVGYEFGGWYTDRACTDGHEFVFGSELDENKTIYAKWTEVSTANYTVIIWKERMTDTYAENGGTGSGKTKYYDFADSYTFTGSVGDPANAVSNGTSSVVDGDAGGTSYPNARIRGTTPGGGNVNTTIAYTGYHCADYDTNVTVAPDGTTVVNVYYDRNTVTYTFWTYGQSSGGRWELSANGSTQYNGDVLISDGNGGYTRYTGQPRYGDGNRYYYLTDGNVCNPERVYELSWVYITSGGSTWNEYQKSTGLYGEPLDWPTDPNIWWYENHDNTAGTGTRMTYKSAFLPMDDDMTVEYWGNTSSTGATIHFWTQDVGGNTYTDQYTVSSGAGTFNINDKFTGFEAYQYRIDNGQWQNVGELDESTGIYGDGVRYSSRLDIRYNRLSAMITFLDGAYYSGNGIPMDETPQAEPFHETDPYYYGESVASYNTGGADYYTPPDKAGYTFAGWYADDACTVEYDFTTMPVTGITVYAKWVQNQYRVFLHPNVPPTDTTLDWGSEDQDMNFRVSSGGKVSTPTGRRADYEMVGWYLDPECTVVFNADNYILNDTTVTATYNKTEDFTDPMDKWGNINGQGSNSDTDRPWITKKLDLYAKWRAVLTGADGIGVKYDPNGGSNAPSDTTLYLDNSDVVAQGASTPPDDTQQFLYWVVQKWNGTEYADTDDVVYPGDTFTVLKENAQIIELEGSTPEDPKYSYTVQLRAEYGPKDAPTPTHLTWYANGGAAADGVTVEYTDPDLQINEAVDIRPANTFTRNGYEFIGWARVDSTVDGYTLSEKDLTEDDLFLKYENGEFLARIPDTDSGEWEAVTQAAADEAMPYHDLYAVWRKKTYTVTVVKEVIGLEGDQDVLFAFTPAFAELTGSDYSSAFSIVANPDGADVPVGQETVHYDHEKEFAEVPFDTVFTITEQDSADFSLYDVHYEVTDADDPDDNVQGYIGNGAEFTVHGNVTLTYTNVRKTKNLKIKKTDAADNDPLGGAVFTVSIDGTDYELTSDGEDGFLKNEDFETGLFTIPYGTYTLTETYAPDGYIGASAPISITVTAESITAAGGITNYTVVEPAEGTDYYTLIIPNSPGIELPMTGGSGTWMFYGAGIALSAAAAVLLLYRRRVAIKNE